MRLRYHDINKDGQLRHMIADDLYSDDIKQVFDAKTGRHVGHIQSGVAIISDEQMITPPAPVERDPRQGTLF